MKIHEYQAKELFKKYSIPTPKGKAFCDLKEALQALTSVSASGPWVIKAQIHAGGRGKAGGVKVAKTIEEAKEALQKIFGMKLITPQTGPEGKIVKRILIEEGSSIDKELYVALTLDRSKSQLLFMVSREGGMEIEEVAIKSPEKIHKEWIHPLIGIRDFQIRNLTQFLGLPKEAHKEFYQFIKNLLTCYLESDLSLLEINPCVLTRDKHIVALDAKLDIEENSLYRHPSFHELRDLNEENPQETEAKKFELAYISLDGNIGCMVNGAGLAMATMDIIQYEGGSPANFLDVGGGASESKVKEAFKIILQDPKVKAILVNIFGGIMKCDVIASGIIGAAKELKLTVPLVVRLEGTNVEAGKKLLNESSLKIIAASGMKDAASKAVQAARSHAS